MEVIATTEYPADVGYINSITFSDTATPTSPDGTPEEVDSASFTAGRVDNDKFLEGRDVVLELEGQRTKTMRILDLDRDGEVETSASLTGVLGRFVTGELSIPPMQNGAVGAALDYLMQKTGEMRVSNAYRLGNSNRMLCASLQGHSAVFDVASGREVRPADESNNLIVGEPWRPAQDVRQGFHTHFETFVDETELPFSYTPWNWSARPIFGNLDLGDNMRHVIKFVAQRGGYSNVARMRAQLGTNLKCTVEVTLDFYARQVTVDARDGNLSSTFSTFAVSPEIDLDKPFVLAVSFIYGLGFSDETYSTFTVNAAVASPDGAVVSKTPANAGNTFMSSDIGRLGSPTSEPLAFNYVMARSLVYDVVDPTWDDWWRLREIPSIATLVGTPDQVGGAVRHHVGNGWDYLSQVLATYGYEIRADNDQIIVTPTAFRRVEIENHGPVSRSHSRPEVSEYDINYAQNVTQGFPSFSLAYSADEVGEVDISEYAYSSDSIQGEFHYLYQPSMSGVRGNPSQTVYNVTDADDRLVSSRTWIQGGGYVRVNLTEDFGGIEIKLHGPEEKLDGYTGPYTIRNLRVSGSGFSTDERSIRVHTGVPPALGTESVPSVSPPTAIGYSAVAQIASKMNDNYSVFEEISFDCDLFMQGSLPGGNPVGAVFEYEDQDYRITRYESNMLSASITARPHVTMDRVQKVWGKSTMGELTTAWGLKQYQFQDIRKSILEGT